MEIGGIYKRTTISRTRSWKKGVRFCERDTGERLSKSEDQSAEPENHLQIAAKRKKSYIFVIGGGLMAASSTGMSFMSMWAN
jgi:hypothetical protein